MPSTSIIPRLMSIKRSNIEARVRVRRLRIRGTSRYMNRWLPRDTST